MIKVGIVGASGYTGVELLRLLLAHPDVELLCITSRSQVGQRITDTFPSLYGAVALCFSEPSIERLGECDVVFFATPNGTAMQMAVELLAAGTRLIDLSADFRIKDIAVWEKWYAMAHQCPQLLAQAAYGLVEQNRDLIRPASLVANPGCYPTAVGLGWLPLVEAGYADTSCMIADAKSGVSGAGRTANVPYLLAEASEDISAYGVDGHRHEPEIIQILSQACRRDIQLTFIAHLTPMIRGMLATLYTRVELSVEKVRQLYQDRYRSEPFVQVLPAGHVPHTRSVRGSNTCQIAIGKKADMLIVLSVIDNLNKGAAGQAVQNMNVMFELAENSGLAKTGMIP